jgi:hypothetical protein
MSRGLVGLSLFLEGNLSSSTFYVETLVLKTSVYTQDFSIISNYVNSGISVKRGGQILVGYTEFESYRPLKSYSSISITSRPSNLVSYVPKSSERIKPANIYAPHNVISYTHIDKTSILKFHNNSILPNKGY